MVLRLLFLALVVISCGDKVDPCRAAAEKIAAIRLAGAPAAERQGLVEEIVAECRRDRVLPFVLRCYREAMSSRELELCDRLRQQEERKSEMAR